MKSGALLLIVALVAAPACGGGGGGGSTTGGSPTPLAASFVPDQPSPAAKTVAMAQGARANDVVTVNVTITDTSGVFGAAFDVTYDAGHASFLGYSAGSALEQGGNTPVYNVGNPTSGRVVVGAARTGGTTTNVAGTVKLIGLQFRVNAAGTFPVAIENQSLYDGQQPNPQVVPGISWFAGALAGA